MTSSETPIPTDTAVDTPPPSTGSVDIPIVVTTSAAPGNPPAGMPAYTPPSEPNRTTAVEPPA